MSLKLCIHHPCNITSKFKHDNTKYELKNEAVSSQKGKRQSQQAYENGEQGQSAAGEHGPVGCEVLRLITRAAKLKTNKNPNHNKNKIKFKTLHLRYSSFPIWK